MPSLDRRTFLGSTPAVAGITAFAGVATPNDAPDQLPGKTPHTKFAANIEMWWTKLPLLERIRKASSMGFPAVEFWPWQNKDIDAITALVAELDIAIAQFTAWGFRPGLNNPDHHTDFCNAIEQGCQIAKKLNCKKMTVVGGDDQPGMTQPEMHQNIVDGLRKGAPIAEQHDIMLILEPMNIRVDHKGHCLYGSTPTIQICEAVNSSHVKINWDLYHLQITEGDLCGHLREGIDWVGYLQLADHPGRFEPGTGEIHYNRVLKEAYELGYRDFVGVECRPQVNEWTAATKLSQADQW